MLPKSRAEAAETAEARMHEAIAIARTTPAGVVRAMAMASCIRASAVSAASALLFGSMEKLVGEVQVLGDGERKVVGRRIAVKQNAHHLL